MREIPWQTSNIPGPRMGISVNADVAHRIIARSKRPLIVVGAELLDEGDEALEKVLRLARLGIPVAATAHSAKRFGEKGQKVVQMGITDLTDRLKDETWEGCDGKGNYDLVIFLGIEYWLLSQMAATLKHFSKIETVNISRYYQPNTTYSFPNLREDLWLGYMEELCKRCEKAFGERQG